MYLSLAILSSYDIFSLLLAEANIISKGGKKCRIILKLWVPVAQNLLLKICAKLVEYTGGLVY